MAYMSQERKNELAPAIKAVLKKYGMKGSISVRNGSTLLVNISEGRLDMIKAANEHNKAFAERTGREFYEVKGYYQVNEYRVEDSYTGEILEFLKELSAAMNAGNFDNSDAMSDYFHVGWYAYINIGRWNKPYKFVA